MHLSPRRETTEAPRNGWAALSSVSLRELDSAENTMAANEHTSIREGTVEPRRTRNQPARIPFAATGERTGHCFIAAFLAHVMHVDLAKNKIPKEEITKLRSLEGVPLRGYIGGSAQQIIADYKRVGYIIVNPDKRTATQYTSNHVADPADLQWALLVHWGNRHIEPIATQGGLKCGLLSRLMLLLNSS